MSLQSIWHFIHCYWTISVLFKNYDIPLVRLLITQLSISIYKTEGPYSESDVHITNNQKSLKQGQPVYS